jgi:DNA-binding MarR family transcriptional regulator
MGKFTVDKSPSEIQSSAAKAGEASLLDDLLHLSVALPRLLDAAASKQFGSLARARILAALAEGPMEMSVLANRLDVHTINVTRLADQLEAAGLVHREAVEGDRRRTRLVLDDAEVGTAAGHFLRKQLSTLLAGSQDVAHAIEVVAGAVRRQEAQQATSAAETPFGKGRSQS